MKPITPEIRPKLNFSSIVLNQQQIFSPKHIPKDKNSRHSLFFSQNIVSAGSMEKIKDFKNFLMMKINNFFNRSKNKISQKSMKISHIHGLFTKKFPLKTKVKNFLVIVYLVKKFIQVIKSYTLLKRILRLKEYHFRMIGDDSNFYDNGNDFGNEFFMSLANSHYCNNFVPIFF